jgi:5-methylcytosine-specific restriction enzyme A
MSDHGAIEAARHGIARSSHWPAVEKAFRASSPFCACCAKQDPKTPVQVHHKFPFHYAIALGRPDLELDPRNLITLCETEKGKPGENHHLLVGHADDFQSSNLTVEEDALKTFHGMTAIAIRADKTWAARVAGRLKPLDKMTAEDKDAFIKSMNSTYPLKK